MMMKMRLNLDVILHVPEEYDEDNIIDWFEDSWSFCELVDMISDHGVFESTGEEVE